MEQDGENTTTNNHHWTYILNVTNFLVEVNDALRGTDDSAPTISTEDSNYWIRTLNKKIDELYRDSKVLLDSSFLVSPPNEAGTVATTATTTLTGTSTFFTDYKSGDTIIVDGETVRTIDTITDDTTLTVTVAFSNTASAKTFTRATIIASGTTDYALNRKFLSPANRAYVLTTSSTKVYLDYIKPRASQIDSRRLYIWGVNPQNISFTDTIDSTENIVSGTLFVPGNYAPADLSTSDGDAEIPLPDPYWGVLAVASDVAGNDITYEDKEANLNAKANARYRQMTRNSRRNTYNQPNPPPTNVNRIRGTEIN